jgi:hypothetical protein
MFHTSGDGIRIFKNGEGAYENFPKYFSIFGSKSA